MDDDQVRRPFGRVFGEATSHFASLVRLDMRLLQAEMKQKGQDVIASGVFGAVALTCFLLGAFALVECLILALIWFGVAALWATLVIGVCFFLAGFVSLNLARRTMAGWSLAPEQTLIQVRSDLAALKEGMRHVAS